ncbi:MAG: presenilin family intramembrane aspartyl protease [Candidatus Staskawiczbacteria bacterium]
MKYQIPKTIKDKKIKRETSINFWKSFLIPGGLFLLMSLLSIISAFQLNKLVILKQFYLPSTSWQDFLLCFLIIVFLISVLFFYKKSGKLKELICKGLFIVPIFWGGMIVLNLFLPVFVSLFIVGGLIAIWLESPTVLVHNTLILLGLAGVSCFLGLTFNHSIIIALLLFFSVYNFIAILKIKNIDLIIKEMLGAKAILGFIVPKELDNFKGKLKQIKPGVNSVIINGGDIVLPILLTVSMIPFGNIKVLIVLLFSLIGYFFSYWLSVNQEKYMDNPETGFVLPPIALFVIIGYFITLFL